MDIAAISKICSKCKTNKPTTDFAKSGDGFQAYCRDCMKEYRKKNIDEDKPDENALYILSYEHNLSGPFKIGRTKLRRGTRGAIRGQPLLPHCRARGIPEAR